MYATERKEQWLSPMTRGKISIGRVGIDPFERKSVHTATRWMDERDKRSSPTGISWQTVMGNEQHTAMRTDI